MGVSRLEQLAYRSLLVTREADVLRVQINRPEANNSIDGVVLDELHAALDEAEYDESIRVVLLTGTPAAFCTGMDLSAFAATAPQAGKSTGAETSSALYMALLRKIALHRTVVISVVEGRALAGGVGLVAASDFVVASDQSSFGVPEVIWGLLPSMVLPYLVRRVGHQAAYRMTLLTMTIPAVEAKSMNLIDVCAPADQLDEQLDRLLHRIRRVHPPVVPVAKRYFREISTICAESESLAVATTTALAQDPHVRSSITDFIRHRRFPWATP